MSDYTIVEVDHAADDYAGTDVPGEFRRLTDALGGDRLALTCIRISAHRPRRRTKIDAFWAASPDAAQPR